MVVHSFMNSMDPPGSADMSQMASKRWGSCGQPGDEGDHGEAVGCSKTLASEIERRRGEFGAQYMPLIIQEAYDAI